MKILIADDNEIVLEFFRHLLETSGLRMHVIKAINGEQAVAMALEHFPHLILMDIEMPVMNGIEALRRLRSETSTSGIPIVAVTGLSMEGDRERMISEGFDGYIQKPIYVQELMAEVKKYIPGSDVWAQRKMGTPMEEI